MAVYKSYDQEGLDRQYNARATVPDFDQIVEHWKRRSQAFRQSNLRNADEQYGPHARERLDIFPAGEALAPTLVFFHGGYWQSMDKEVFQFIAAGFSRYGITTVFVNYPLAPEASMDKIIASCRQAMVWLHHNVAKHNGNPNNIHIAGHSAGGHIVAMLMTTNWQELDEGITNDLIKGGCAVSGLFDLRPIQLSYLNKVLGLDKAMTRRNSPVFLWPTCNSPLIVSVGQLESDEFHAQSQDLIEAWAEKGLAITRRVLANTDHFSILEHLTQEEAALNRAIRVQMGLRLEK